MKKSYLVEGYRFVIAISIMIFHFLKTWSNTNNLRQGVEFFFVLSGFLLMAHCEKASGVGGETVGKLMVGKLKSVYPETFVVFWMAAIAVTVLEKKNFWTLVYQHLHQLLFVTNIFREKASWLSGTGQLWFVMSQIWGTLILAWLVKTHRNAYENILAPFLIVGGYAIVIRCSGNLNASLYLTIGEHKIFLPILLLRALAGLTCGTVGYMGFKKLNGLNYTKFAKRAGTALSLLCFSMALMITTHSSKHPINSYNWRGMIVVLLYTVSIVLAFIFAQEYPIGDISRKLCAIGGRLSMSFYMTHMLVLYIMGRIFDMPYFRKRWLLIFFTGTVILSILFDVCVKLLRKGWAAFMVWLKKMCIAEPIE